MTESLLDAAPAADASATAEAPLETQAPAASVADAADIDKVTDDTPLLAGKYKTAADLEQGYKEQSKMLRELQSEIPKAPESYTFDFKETPGLESVEITPEDPLVSAMTPVFKAANLTQEQVNAISGEFLKFQMSSQEDVQSFHQDELKKVQPEVLNKLALYRDKLPESERDDFTAGITTAATANTLYKALGLEGEKSIPVSGAQVETKSAQEWIDAAMEYKKEQGEQISFDRAKQAHYAKLMQKGIELRDKAK